MKIILFNKKKYLNNQIKNINGANYFGDWCLNDFNNNKEQKKLISNISDSFNGKSKNNFLIIKNLYEKLLKKLTTTLNKIHNLELNKRGWEIIVGRWLWLYLDAIFIRWDLIESLKKKKFDKIYSLKIDDKYLLTTTSEAMSSLPQNSEIWNIAIFNEIMTFIKFKNLIKLKSNNLKKDRWLSKKKIEINYQSHVINFKKKNNILIYKLDLPRMVKAGILLNKTQIPPITRTKKFIFKANINGILRNRFKSNLKFKNNKLNEFENFACNLLTKVFPSIYLEDFKELEKVSLTTKWPKNPKYILSSYGHYIDEIFKIYLAKKIQTKSKYLIFQHGAAGMYQNHLGVLFEEKICDHYFTWGWKKNIKNIPLYITKSLPILKLNKQKKISNMLISVYQMPLMPIKSAYGYSNFSIINLHYTKFILKFLFNLDKRLIDKTNIKVLNRYKPFYLKEIIKKKFKKIKFIENNQKIYQLSNKYSINIETYLSTGFLELMCQNQPVVILLDNKLINLNYETGKLFKKLKSVNICFTSTKKAVDFLNIKNFNISKWWESKNLQKVREEFCYMFVNNEKNKTSKFLDKFDKLNSSYKKIN